MKYLLLLVLLLGCMQDGNWTPPSDFKPGGMVDGDLVPPYPGEEGKKTLEGIDIDKDGVRDDLEIFINYKCKTADLRKAYKQFVKYKMLTLVNSKNKERSNYFVHQGFRAMSCIHWITGDVFKTLKFEKELDKEIYNTEIRVKASMKVSANFHGQGDDPEVVKTQDRNKHYKFCEFKPDKKIIRKEK